MWRVFVFSLWVMTHKLKVSKTSELIISKYMNVLWYRNFHVQMHDNYIWNGHDLEYICMTDIEEQKIEEPVSEWGRENPIAGKIKIRNSLALNRGTSIWMCMKRSSRDRKKTQPLFPGEDSSLRVSFPLTPRTSKLQNFKTQHFLQLEIQQTQPRDAKMRRNSTKPV